MLWNKLRSPLAGVALVFTGYVIGQVDPARATDVAGEAQRADSARHEATYRHLDTFAEALNYIEEGYVEDVDPEAIIYGAIGGMIGELDQHSAFFTPEELAAFQSDTHGAYAGVGLELREDEGRVFVGQVFPGGPAESAGVLEGDRIVRVDETDVSESSTSDIVMLVRGPRGHVVELGLLRGDELLTLSLVRDVIHVDTVSEQLLDGGIGWIRVGRFQDSVSAEIRDAIDLLESELHDGLSGLILDLRGNPGGLLREAIATTDIFVNEGDIVSTRGRDTESARRWSARRSTTRYAGPLAILVDSGSASASEIVAGALKDLERATLIGTQTFGKGSVQSIIALSDGSGIKLTISRYYTPSGVSIHEQGIEPDAIVNVPAATRARPGQLGTAAEITDAAVLHAVEVLRQAPAANE